jgi:hypothetical protein
MNVIRQAAGIGLFTGLALFGSSANATLLLSGTVGGIDFCAADQNVGCAFGTVILDTNPAVGMLGLGTTSSPIVIGGSLSIFGSLSTSVDGPPLNLLNSSSLQIANLTAAPVTAQFSVGDTGYVGPTGLVSSSGSGTWQLADGSTITMSWFDDPTDQQGAETALDRPGVLVASVTDVATGFVDSFSHNESTALSNPALHSMTLGFDITLAGGGSLLSRGMTMVTFGTVPEPGTLGLVGLAIVGLGFRLRR